MTSALAEERLVAYVDGELSPQEVREVEALLAADAKAQQTVRALREGAALLRGAFAAPLQSQVPDRFVAMIQAATEPPSASIHAFPARQPAAAAPRRWTMPTSIAASVAALAIVLGSVYGVADYRINQEVQRLEAARQQDRRVMEAAVSQALEKQVSGTTVAWKSPDGAKRGEIMPIRTFKNADGQWCREYRETIETGTGAEIRRGVACRVGEGEWRTRLTALDES